MTDKIIDKIRKLNTQAESARAIGSEAEAQAFASKVQEMLFQHNLSLTEVYTKSATKDEEEAVRQVFRPSEHGLKDKRTRVKWTEDLAYTVGLANFCEVLFHTGSNFISFIGFQHNVEVAAYVYEVLLRSADRLADAAYGERWRECERMGSVELCRGFRASFMAGFVSRLFVRIRERQKQQAASSSLAIVVVDRSQQAIDKWKQNSGVKIKTAESLKNKITNAAGYKRGIQAADSVNLDPKGLKDGPPAKVAGELS